MLVTGVNRLYSAYYKKSRVTDLGPMNVTIVRQKLIFLLS